MIEEMRESYRKCLKYLETRVSDVSEDNAKLFLQQQLLSAVGYKQEEIEKLNVAEMSDEAVQDHIRHKLVAVMMNNGQRQKIVASCEVEKSVLEGWEWIGNLSDGRAVLRLPA